MKALCSLVLLPFLFVACGDKHPPAGPGTTTDGMTDDHGHGEAKPLGQLTVGAHTFQATQLGTVEAGKEGMFDLEFPAGKPVPGIVRAWIGIESGTGSMKAKLGKEGERGMHGHVAVPKPIPDGAKLWIEIEENGASQRGSIAWKP